MLDSGADTDFVSDTVVDELGLASWEKEMTVVTVDRDVVGVRRLTSVDSALVGPLVACSSDVPPMERDLSPFSHLRDVPFERAPGGVRMIVGVVHAEACVGVR